MKIKQTIYIEQELAKEMKIRAIKDNFNSLGELYEKLIKEFLAANK